MAINKQKKGEILEKIKKILESAKSVVFVNFHGLNVSDTTKLRRALREQGVGYTVAKKTLMGLVLKGTKVEGDTPVLDGELALAYGIDEIAPARGIAQFMKGRKSGLKFLGGIFSGRFLSAGEMQEIGNIPDMEVLRGMLVNIISSPIRGLVIALSEIAKRKTQSVN